MSDAIYFPLAAGDVWEMVIGAIFFIMWTVAQLLGSRQEAKAKKKQRPPRPQPVDMAERAGQAPQVPRKQEDALRSEVEEFLRRAQGQPAQPKPEPTQERPIEVPTYSPPQAQPVAKKQPRTLRNEGVAEHVQRHLDTDDIAEQTETLGAEVAQSDERLEAHLHDKFDHSLGKLQHRETPEAPAQIQPDIAATVADMLRSPQGMRQLIIANEVLRRPEW